MPSELPSSITWFPHFSPLINRPQLTAVWPILQYLIPSHLPTQQPYLAYCHLTYPLVVNDALTSPHYQWPTAYCWLIYTQSHTRCQPFSQLISSTQPTAEQLINLPKVVTYNRLLIRNPQPTTVWTILWNYWIPRVCFPTQPFLVYYNLTYISVVPYAHSSTFLKTKPKLRPTLLDLLIVVSSIRFQNFTLTWLIPNI